MAPSAVSLDSPASLSLTAPGEERLASAQVRLSMSRVVLAWGFGAIFTQLTAGAVYAAFTRQLGANDALFGFMAGAFPLLSFLQLFAARWLQSRGNARGLMLTAGLTCRATWLLAASLPWIHRVFPAILPVGLVLPLFVGCILVSAAAQALTGPAFFAWMSCLVPDRVGPSFWARRQQVGVVVAIFAVTAGGYVADRAGVIARASHQTVPPLLTYSSLLILASVCGVVDIATFFGIRQPPPEPKPATLPPVWESLISPLRYAEVRNYIAYMTAATVSGSLVGALLWLYCLENLGFTKTQTGWVLTVVPLLGMAISYSFWAWATRTYGSRPVIRFVTVAGLPLGLVWFVVQPHQWWILVPVVFLAGALGAGMELCNIGFMTRACPQVPRPTLIAILSLATGSAAAAASTLGGCGAQQLRNWQYRGHGFHLVNYHLVLLAAMSIGLFNALVLVPKLQEPGAAATREAVKGVLRETREAMRDRTEGARDLGTSLYRGLGTKITNMFQARSE